MIYHGDLAAANLHVLLAFYLVVLLYDEFSCIIVFIISSHAHTHRYVCV